MRFWRFVKGLVRFCAGTLFGWGGTSMDEDGFV